jgi:hypothetical protein
MEMLADHCSSCGIRCEENCELLVRHHDLSSSCSGDAFFLSRGRSSPSVLIFFYRLVIPFSVVKRWKAEWEREDSSMLRVGGPERFDFLASLSQR